MSRILLMNNGFPTAANPKHSSYIKNIKESLEAANHEVFLLVMDSNFTNKYSQFLHYLRFYRRVFNHDFRLYDYVLINHFGNCALPLLKSFKKIKQPVLHWHGEDLFPQKKIFNLLFSLAVKLLPKQTLHITPSRYFKGQLAKKHGIAVSKIAVSPSGGIDTDHFVPLATKNDPTENKVIKIGFASGLTAGKGADAIHSLLQRQDEVEISTGKSIELHYIFYGKQKEKYDPVFAMFPNANRWAVMPSKEMHSFYAAIDILLFPTVRKQESLGLVALEAMSCGVPVLASNAYAIPEFIQPGISGELFALNDLTDLLEKLKKMGDNSNSYQPRPIVVSNYSRHAVICFYKQYFK